MSELLSEASLDQLFRNARTFNAWLPKEVSGEQLQQVFDLAKFGPTSANCSPMRVVFVKSKAAKAKLEPFLSDGNRAKTMEAPVTAIVATDYAFYEQLPKLFPHADAKSWFVGNQPLIDTTAFRNATLQGAYLLLAARAVGLDCGPMSGFDNAGVDAAFFAGTTVKSNFLISIGYGDASRNLFPRSPRLTFDEACTIA
ncbi:nitroreductase family protein [Rhodanobacter thiooxydans]|uniref:Putative NADH dehydrogenase/NAD(P)H nitroreductase RHOFW104T7_11090 n=1 Tax=Rhodanobacter thiooxydans TaxID=416169 RepID=A0A154QII8_9GAMM|nr:malonic semialdehyde reductase [Rhodanobacter thiooxydans]EIL97653.1 malonic semialdehyde reductase [Rhodanobacter thiooxydans LCS2]KZC23939.1 nitroreductase family protein [Rhodanobacter thiooxydans]MCW0201782.1 malonic semialdehyde reductase [Rhodanobacter thiooxydans]